MKYSINISIKEHDISHPMSRPKDMLLAEFETDYIEDIKELLQDFLKSL